ncbi:MAG: tetratricopeptide repeat-containing sensor histidine kinase [Chloroherpetonaceae bacterium]|nr:tetratricopeptide repeat-containing sensor histidine kinase [Chloroherpetonaceae bacterium]
MLPATLKIFLLFIFIFCTTARGHAENESSLTIEKISFLIKKAEENELYGNYKLSDSLAKEALVLSEKMGYRQGVARALHHIGLIASLGSNYKEAYQFYIKSLNIFSSIGDSLGIAKNYNAIGIIYWRQVRYEEALEKHFQSLKIGEALRDTFTIASAVHSLGSIYSRQGQIQKAVTNFRMAIDLRTKISDLRGISTTLNSLALIYSEDLGNEDTALVLFAQSNDIKERINFKKGLSQTLFNIARIYERRGQLEMAEPLHIRALKLDEDLGDTRGIANSYIAIGDLKRKQGKYREAIDLALLAVKMTESVGAKAETADAYLSLVNTYELMGNTSEALRYHKYFSDLQHEAFVQSIAKRSAELSAEHEDAQKQKEIELLKKSYEVGQLEISNQRLVRNVLIGGFLFLALATFLIANRYYYKQRSEAKLIESYEKLRLLNEELQNANKTKSELLSIAAHDLKSPLMTISGFTSLIKEEQELPPKAIDMIEHIQRGSQRMLAIIIKLLDDAALESGKISLQPKVLDIGELVENCVTEFKPVSERKKQRLEAKIERGFSIIADEARMREVVANLISNAIKFSEEKKAIEVSISKSSSPYANRENKADANINNEFASKEFVELTVRDEGQGLSEHDKTLLFGKFQRLSARPTGGESSTGLGLSITRQLVELHGGSIEAFSEGIGKGTLFRVLLPIQ